MKLDVRHNVPLKEHCTFKIGGMADNFVVVNTEEELSLAKEMDRPFILGNGSNILFSDQGYRGTIIKLGAGFSKIEVGEDYIEAGAGALLSKVSSAATDAGLSGLEFASGIPGSVGGGVYMNAGAYDHSLSELFDNKEGFGYRMSPYKANNEIVTKARFNLIPADKEKIKNLVRDYTLRRTSKQPLSYPSAGSFFKRPEGHFAGKLIEDAGLKGYKVGGAQVSLMHAGFIVNTGNASAEDVKALMRHIQMVVKTKFDVDLMPEVIIMEE